MCARTLSQVRRTRAVIEEKRAGAGRITIQLRGERESKLIPPPHTTTKVPPYVGHASDYGARARLCARTHTATYKHANTVSFFHPSAKKEKKARAK